VKGFVYLTLGSLNILLRKTCHDDHGDADARGRADNTTPQHWRNIVHKANNSTFEHELQYKSIRCDFSAL